MGLPRAIGNRARIRHLVKADMLDTQIVKSEMSIRTIETTSYVKIVDPSDALQQNTYTFSPALAEFHSRDPGRRLTLIKVILWLVANNPVICLRHSACIFVGWKRKMRK